MKKIQFIGLLFILLLLAACGGSGESQTDVSLDEEVAEEPTMETESETAVTEPSQVSEPDENLRQCVDSYDPAVDYFPNKVEALYAQSWEVTYANNYKVVKTLTSVASTHAGTDAEVKPQVYILVQCGTPAPALEGEFEEATVIEIPIATAVDGDDALFESFEFLGVADGLLGSGGSGLTEVEQPYLPTVYERQQSGEMVALGYETNLEVLTALEPDIYIKSSGEEEVLAEVADTLNIPVVIYNPYQEGPLGAAEKLKFLSLFYNQEEVANAHLEPAIAHYLELSALAQAQETTPKVLIGFIRNGVWNTRQNERYEMLLVRDAGGQRVLDLPGNGFATVDLEVAVEAGIESDFWFNLAWLPQEETIEEFIDASPELAAFEAVQQGHAFHRFGSRGIDYSYNATINPDVVLADILSILHPTLLPDHEITYLQPILPENNRATIDAPTANLSGCAEAYDSTIDYFPDKVEAQYTSQWSVTYHNHYKVITANSTYGDPDAVPVEERYVLVQCGTPVPEELATVEDALVIEVPVQRLIDGAGGVLGAVELLDLSDPLVALVAFGGFLPTGIEYLPNINAKYAADELAVLEDSSGGWEATLDFEPDLLIDYDSRETIEEARSLGVPYVFYNPFDEGPLGSAEQLKFLALFFNEEAKANEQFASIAEEYIRLRDLTQAQPEKPSVLLGHIDGQGAFNTRLYNRFESILIEDAGGVRVLDESLIDFGGFSSSAPLEVALEEGAAADYWFSLAYLPSEETAADFIATDPLNEEFEALRAGNMFHRFGRDEDYFQTPAIKVNELLADLVSILHPELLPDHEVVHLERIAGE